MVKHANKALTKQKVFVVAVRGTMPKEQVNLRQTCLKDASFDGSGDVAGSGMRGVRVG